MKYCLLAAALLLSACASTEPAPAPEGPIPAIVSTTPAARTEPDLVTRHQAILADVARGGHEIAFVGASIMEGWPNAGAERWNSVWVPRHSVNCGIGGDRTQNVLFRLDDGLLEALAAPNNRIRWVVLNIGSNNTDADSGPEIAEGVWAVVAKIRTRLPETRFVVTLFPRGQWPNPLRAKLREAQDILAAHYSKHDPAHVTVMDMWPFFLTEGHELPATTMPDFLHPSAAAYKVWSDELEKVIPAGR
jgi:lysophospholipase L1-like esterase